MAVLKRAKKSDTKVTPMFTEDNVKSLGRQYADISSQIKALEEQKKALAEKIKQGAEQFGVKDDKGSFYLESEDLMMGKVAKKSFKIDQDKAVKTLESMGIGDVVLTLKNTGWADVLLYGHRDVLEITASILKLVALLQKVTGFEYGIVVRNVVWNKVEIEGNLSVKSIDYVLNASVYE